MSENTTLMQPDEAFAVVHQQIYAPAFFQKLAADYGIQPQNEAEAGELMRQAGVLRQAYEQQQQKQASASGNLIQAGGQYLNQLCGDTEPGDAYQEQHVKQAAAGLSQNDDIAKAVLSLEAALAAAAEQA